MHPNNPDGRHWNADEIEAAKLAVIDESFCDTCPEASLIALAARPGVIVLKSFGKFWGLAGLRLVGDGPPPRRPSNFITGITHLPVSLAA